MMRYGDEGEGVPYRDPGLKTFAWWYVATVQRYGRGMTGGVTVEAGRVVEDEGSSTDGGGLRDRGGEELLGRLLDEVGEWWKKE